MDEKTTDRPQMFLDPLTGSMVVVNRSRQTRPNLPSEGCPFCPGGLEAPHDYDVMSFPNRWPALGEGCCEVVLYTSDHDASFWSLGMDGVRKVIDLWSDRTRELGSRPDVDYVLIFENRGAEVGATIAHPHGQIYAFDTVPPAPLRELSRGTLDLPPTESPLIVTESGDWVCWVPATAVYPYELRIAPRKSIGSLTETDWDRDELASVLVDSLERLDVFFDEATPYMMWIHQRPTDGGQWDGAVLHFHVTPLRRASGVTRFVAAAELGAEVYFNPVEPTDAASNLRDATRRG